MSVGPVPNLVSPNLEPTGSLPPALPEAEEVITFTERLARAEAQLEVAHNFLSEGKRLEAGNICGDISKLGKYLSTGDLSDQDSVHLHALLGLTLVLDLKILEDMSIGGVALNGMRSRAIEHFSKVLDSEYPKEAEIRAELNLQIERIAKSAT